MTKKTPKWWFDSSKPSVKEEAGDRRFKGIENLAKEGIWWRRQEILPDKDYWVVYSNGSFAKLDPGADIKLRIGMTDTEYLTFLDDKSFYLLICKNKSILVSIGHIKAILSESEIIVWKDSKPFAFVKKLIARVSNRQDCEKLEVLALKMCLKEVFVGLDNELISLNIEVPPPELVKCIPDIPHLENIKIDLEGITSEFRRLESSPLQKMSCLDDLKEIKIDLDRITFAVRKIIAEISGLLKDQQVSVQQMDDTTGKDEKTEMLIEVLTGSLAEFTLLSKGLDTMSENVNRLEYTLEIALQKKNVAISQFGLIMTNLGVSSGFVAAAAGLFGANSSGLSAREEAFSIERTRRTRKSFCVMRS
ncbi:hypothetical protein MKW98_007369 [Papaver atlanticum]|uniref:Magnesium transporter n=1 Tax=Papaver atlanticum TaxID=357466 RepID=A0AAD4SD33_9MAGN|nr:hypothetical protein MKW98_007369 [Papaver atlanticum]